jgi:hypothetical protein
VPRPLSFRKRRTLLPMLLLLIFVLPFGFAVPFALWSSFILSPLQKQYFPTYMAMAMTGKTAGTPSVWWIWKTGPKRKPELAGEADVVSAPAADRKSLPLALSPEAQAEGWTGLLRAQQAGNVSGQEAILQNEFFAGQSFARMMITPLCGMALVALLFLGLRGRLGSQSEHEERHGRRTKGPELTSASQWARSGKADGIRLRLVGKFGLPASFRIPKTLESSHILLMGDTGAGKSNAIRQILRQVQERGEAAIVYDPAGEFVQEFYRSERGDYILNPLDERCPFWDIHEELYQAENADAIAAAMIPERDFENRFFSDAPRRVLARLLKQGPSVTRLLEWMADPAKIDERLYGTPQAAYLDPKAGPQRAGVLASLNMIADSLDLLPEKSTGRESFVTGKWRFERTRWVFLTSKPSMRERIRPLHSAWLDLLILRMMEPCVNPAKPVWFVLDELASLNKLPQLHTAVTENRKYGNPVVLGFQGRSQLEKRYGQDAEAMLSQPATKIFFKTSEPRAAKWVSETLGEIEIERLKESRTPELIGSRKTFAMEIATKPLIMASEIAGLEPLYGFVKQENRVVPVRFAFVPKRSLQPEFIERKMTIPEPRLLPPPVAEPFPAPADVRLSKPIPPPAVQTSAEAEAHQQRNAADVVPGLKTEPTLPLFAELASEEPQPEARRSAFKKKEGTAREWKPVD